MNNTFSKSIDSAYFTQFHECKVLLEYADQIWGIKGSRCLEPAVGAGAFVKASEKMGLGIEWVTNELNPDCANFTPDTSKDFLEMGPETYDFVLGNPPFSGQVKYDGKRITLAEAFVQHSLKFAPRVAFLLPPSFLRYRYLSRLEGVDVVAWTEPTFGTYTLGGAGGGEDKDVKVTTVFFERRPGFSYDYDTSPIPGLDWVDDPAEATHAFKLWGSTGQARPLDGSWGKPDPYCTEAFAVVTDPRIESLVASKALINHGGRFTSCAPTCSPGELNFLHRHVLGL